MNLIQFACTLIAMTTGFATPHHSTTVKDSAVVFAGTTPCTNLVRPLHKIVPESDCEHTNCHCAMVEWKLTLYQDPVTLQPTTYKLSSINRFIVKETNMYSQPGTKNEREGKWTIVKVNPRSMIYRLEPGNSELSIDLLKLSDDLLHVLDREGKLMIGNEFWSYTLNRVANQ